MPASQPTPQQLISFLKDCYVADNREAGVINVFSKKAEHLYFLAEADLLTGKLPIYPVDYMWGENIERELAIYLKEKDLWLGFGFICGKVHLNGKNQKVSAPLLLIPASFEKRARDYFLSTQLAEAQINPVAWQILEALGGELSPEWGNQIIDWLQEGELDFATISQLKKHLDQAIPSLDTNELLFYPELPNKKAIKKAEKESGKVSILPSCCSFLLKKSKTAQHIIHELGELSKLPTEQLSNTLLSFLGQKPAIPNRKQKEIDDILVPAILSEAQRSALKAIESYDNLMVVGPPGTGKSYTIAAMAIHFMGKGKSVLISSSNDQAVDVVGNKISQDFRLGDLVMRGGNTRDYKTPLKDKLQNWLSGIGVAKPKLEESELLQVKLKQIRLNLAKSSHDLNKATQKSIDRGRVLTNKSSIISSLKTRFIKWQTKRERPIWKLMDEYLQLLEKRNANIGFVLQDSFDLRLAKALKMTRNVLKRFLSGLRARHSSRQDDLFASVDFQYLTQIFPIWLVRLADIGSVLPFQKQLFDLVIIDEASQCDIASILPVLQRAKKVVIVGDPQQLRHVSFLSLNKLSATALRYQVSSDWAERYHFREKSALDVFNNLIASQEQVVFLDEHYRSLPGIISFSNQQFYGGKLRIMTATPQNESINPIRLVNAKGKRDIKGHNEEEAQYIIRALKQIAQEEKGVQKKSGLGVLSPFRSQVEYIQELATEQLDISIFDDHQLLIGTAHSFQGEERDKMLLSFVVDDNSHSASFRFLNTVEIFNVSITRAKSETQIIHSLQKRESLAKSELLQKYFAQIETVPDNGLPMHFSAKTKDSFANEMIEWLHQYGIQEVRIGQQIAGVPIDLVGINKDSNGRIRPCCIDLIGFPGEFTESFPIERYEVLLRIGIQVFPLSYEHWLFQKEKAEKGLMDFLANEY